MENDPEKTVTQVEEIAKQAENVRTIVSDIRDYCAELDTIKEDIRSKRLAVTQISTNVQTKDSELQKIYKNISDLETKAQELVAKIESENTQLATYLVSFENLKVRLNDKDTGLEPIYTWAQQQKEQTERLLEQSRADQELITEMKMSSTKNAEDIEIHKKDVEGYRKEVEKIYGYINGQGLAHSFTERQKGLVWVLGSWAIMLFISACLVSWAMYEIFKELPLDEAGKIIFSPSSLFYRLSFVSPLLLIFFVALRQYSRERRLLESYAFKAATAKALESYTEILARRFQEEKFKHRILAFVLHAMTNIYRHPNNELSKVEDEKSWAKEFEEILNQASKPVVTVMKNISPTPLPENK